MSNRFYKNKYLLASSECDEAGQLSVAELNKQSDNNTNQCSSKTKYPKSKQAQNCSNRDSKKRKDSAKYHQNSKHIIIKPNDLHNLRGQPPTPKPAARIPRQVDAFVMAFLFQNLYIFYGKDCHLSHDDGGLWMLSSAYGSHTLYAESLL